MANDRKRTNARAAANSQNIQPVQQQGNNTVEIKRIFTGRGKTRCFIKPNLMQCFSSSDYPTSFVVTDYKGTDCGKMFQQEGYRIKILNDEARSNAATMQASVDKIDKIESELGATKNHAKNVVKAIMGKETSDVPKEKKGGFLSRLKAHYMKLRD